jgi:ABC-2 type transport system permease protein
MAENAATSSRPSGSIYDLGYRSYEGVRLGRRYAVTSLFVYTLLSIWGIGRSWLAKLFPIGLAIVAMVPALVVLAVAAIAPDDFEVLEPHEYFSFISIILALLCAVIAPDLIGRDQRNRTLSLYFSRALSRFDYVGSKLAAFILSLFLVLAIPQVIAQAGNAVATEDLVQYIQDNADLIPPILGSAAVVALVMATVSLAIAMQTSRRAFSTGAVIVAFVILSGVGNVLVETLTGDSKQYGLLISPLDILEGMVLWIFNANPEPDTSIAKAGLDGIYYLIAALAYITVSLAIIYRRVQRLSI